MESHKMNHLPLARLVARVGVTGHRPNGLTQANEKILADEVGKILDVVRDAVEELFAEERERCQPEAFILRVVSPLAEGADRIVANAALARGFELQCPLPFRRDEYEKDFEQPESRREFWDLLARATAVMELDGSRETPEQASEAYESVGRMVLSQSDLLVAIWDGEKSTRKGGTGQIVEEALRRGILTVWISARATHVVRLLTDPSHLDMAGAPMERLGQHLKSLLRLQSQTHSETPT